MTLIHALPITPEITITDFPGMEIPKIVCAANVFFDERFIDGRIIIPGARHYDKTMHAIEHNIKQFIDWNPYGVNSKRNIQGFIDQFGNFYTREQAYQLCKHTGQQILNDRNHSDSKLFSEGLY